MAARERFHVAVTRGNREQLGGPGLGSENGANGRLGLAGTAGTKVGLPLSRSGIQRQSLRPAKRCLLNRQTHPRTAISRYENLSLCVASLETNRQSNAIPTFHHLSKHHSVLPCVSLQPAACPKQVVPFVNHRPPPTAHRPTSRNSNIPNQHYECPFLDRQQKGKGTYHVTRFYHTTTLPHLSLFPAGAWTVPRLSDGNVFFGVGAVCGLTNESSPLPSVAVKKFIA